jgi:hypothetical protein
MKNIENRVTEPPNGSDANLMNDVTIANAIAAAQKASSFADIFLELSLCTARIETNATIRTAIIKTYPNEVGMYS